MEESRERDVRPAQHPALPLLLSDCHGDPACQRGGALGAQAYLLQMSSWGRHVHTGRELSTPMHPKEKLFRASLLMLLSPQQTWWASCKKSTLMALVFSSTNASDGFFLPVHVTLAPRRRVHTPIPARDPSLIWGRVFLM